MLLICYPLSVFRLLQNPAFVGPVEDPFRAFDRVVPNPIKIFSNEAMDLRNEAMDLGKKTYRLTDIVRCAGRRGDGDCKDQFLAAAYVNVMFPLSIASEYLRAAHHENDLDALARIVRERTLSPLTEFACGADFPAQDECAMHIQLGDTLWKGNYWKLSAEALWSGAAQFEQGRTFLESISRDLANRSHVVVVTDLTAGSNVFDPQKGTSSPIQMLRPDKYQSFLRAEEKKSMEFLTLVITFLRKRGLAVRTRIDHPADCDLVFLSRARCFVQGPNGLSQLVANMVRRLDGQVITASPNAP
mmetsp:Transcript_61977/g.103004  ORF Transcript_61977/g.103004 Transcript_61977/m.103004 type:complete len:301 (-) Transcript_61977:273-1175(-)